MNYTIKQISEMTGLSIPTIRYYDKEGLLPDLRRKESGYRIFSDRDLKTIDLIECFKASGLTIREIRHFMSLVKQGDVTLAERLSIFQMHIARLEEKLAAVQNALEHSRRTLAFYEIAVKTGSEETAKNVYYARTESYDGIILDVMMPKLDGFEVLKLLRSEGCRVPILLLTAKTEVEARIQGLNLGADDYLPKPFDMGELLARIRAMLRRREQYQPYVLTYGDLSLYPQSCELWGNGRSVRLSRLESRLMEVLMLNQGIYLSSEDLLVKIWGYETEAELGSVWVYISYLRKHIKSLGARVEIRARRGVGYSLEQTP